MSRIDAERAKELIAEGALLLDVRTRGEFAFSPLPGAVNIPLQELGSRLSELDAQRPIVLACRSGARSASAAALLKNKGFKEVHDLGPGHLLTGGAAVGWSAAITPLLASLTLGLAPFVPEPHIFGKVRWVLGGGVGMKPIDVFDLVMHGAPFLWLAWTVIRIVSKR